MLKTTVSTAAEDTVPLDEFCPPEFRDDVVRLAPLLYSDLKKVARRERGRVFSPHTLTTTSLVHESYLRLKDHSGFESQAHYLRVAAITMRHLLIDRARSQLAAKHGGGARHLGLEAADEVVIEDETAVLAVHESLQSLARFAPRLAQVVECRFFGGYTNREIAEALGVVERTVERDWESAKAWLSRELGQPVPGLA